MTWLGNNTDAWLLIGIAVLVAWIVTRLID
jgi:hypothetical protein